MFKFDEHQACLQQNQRKDSASSEVAALLCISGRTSRISSVGSQGSAISRLSAISGVSRSPSPHKMLLETSFCGPKPVDNAMAGSGIGNIDMPSSKILEQVLLARKHDPTQAVMAEGIHIDTSDLTPLSAIPQNGKIQERKAPTEIVISKPHVSRSSKPIQSKSTSKSTKPVIGVTSGGVEYIRIKLKPDHMYSDRGLGPNEKELDDPTDTIAVKKPPATLSLSEHTPKKSSQHFSQLVKTDDAITKHPVQRLNPSGASPKLSRHIALRDTGSRSPSPITVSVSRKNSLCSLFKSKDLAPSPESPPVSGLQRKKSGASLLQTDSPRDRSRSKSRESDRGSSQNNTPSKQKSVLAIFKPKRSGSKSKSASPVDPEAMSALDGVQFQFTDKDVPDPIPRPKSRLRYYDSPLDGKSIHIPLHTPPDEKDCASDDICTVQVIKERRQQNESQAAAAQVNGSVAKLPERPRYNKELPAIPLKKSTNPSNQKVSSSHIIEYADGSIRIPLKSPTTETADNDTATTAADSLWSIEANQNSSLESQETVISTQAPSQTSIENTTCSTSSKRQPVDALPHNGFVSTAPISSSTVTPTAAAVPYTFPAAPPPSPFVTSTTFATNTTITNTTTMPASSATKEKKRILFCTKIGSGSEEQLFATQLSLSKTESLCSQLSEQASILDSPGGIAPANVIDAIAIAKKYEDAPISVVTMRNKDQFDDAMKKTRARTSQDLVEQDERKLIRHSRYIENIDEIMERQRILDEAERNTGPVRAYSSSTEDASFDRTASMSTIKKRKPEPVLQIPGPPTDPRQSTEELSRAGTSTSAAGGGGGIIGASGLSGIGAAGSSESERDSEMDPNSMKQHLPRQIGNVEEESTGLVAQESFDDELPYIPTTLPEERSVLVSLVPVKERSLMDVRTCPVERPRSTTPLNPSCLEAYCGTVSPFGDDTDIPFGRGEKLRISLPRRDSRERGPTSKSPRRPSNASGKSWFEFAEQGLGGTPTSATSTNAFGAFSTGPSGLTTTSSDVRNVPAAVEEDPPPLPPRKPQTVSQWINFENIPEKRKPPKRITTLPNKESNTMSGHEKGATASHQYNYVNPEECQCECHEIERDGSVSGTSSATPITKQVKAIPIDDQQLPEDSVPLLDETEHADGLDRTTTRYTKQIHVFDY